VNIIAFVLFIVAALIFLIGDPFWTRYQRSALHVGLFVLTVGFIVEFCAKTHAVGF
jgi:hypothetical protein